MTNGPTTGASESAQRSWQASRFWARVVGIAVFLAPIAAAWIAVWLVRDKFYQPDGTIGIVVWVLQSILVATLVAAAVERVARRLLPLQVLLGMSLTFPDHAPSRFKVALLSGTLKKLRSRVPDISDGGTASVQTAAEHAVYLVTMLGKHERLTRGHTERVRAYSDLIAVELGLSRDERDKLAWAAMLHDIGKLSVPAEILNKGSRPTGSEWAILASHPSAGLELLEPLQGWLGDWLLAASEHHERWDGAGYPQGLSGLDISLAGRIVAVADAYDVITSHRSYKKPMSIEAARNELVECAGNQFDPNIVRAMLTASKSDRTGLARFAGLLELRTVSQALSSISTAPAAVAAAAVALPAVFGVAAPGLALPTATGPDEVAFVQEEDPSDGQPPTVAGSGTVTPTQSTTTDPESSTTTDPTSATSSPAPTSTTLATSNPTTGPATSAVAPSTTTTAQSTTTTTTTTTAPTTTTTAPPLDDCQRLRNGESDLAGADLVGCDLSGLELSGVNLQRADLTEADLRNVQLSSFDLTSAKLNDALLNGAQMSNGSATGITAQRLQAAGVTITNVNFSASTLLRSNFSSSDLTGVSFAGSSLNRVNFAGSQMEGVDLSRSSLNDADFADIDGQATNFSATNSQGAIFDRSDISRSNFTNALLSRATLVDTVAEAVILAGTGINKANLTRTDLTAASGTPFQTQNATYDATICPDGVTRNTTCWP